MSTPKKTRILHTHELNRTRAVNGQYKTLFPLLKKYPEKFRAYMRIEVLTFEYILSKINHLLMKNWCNLHVQPILPEERLVLTLRFLATGNTYTDLAFSFKMGIKTVSCIVSETMDAIWVTLSPLHMAVPSVNDFVRISKDFETKWNFPHCSGAIDGRHIPTKKPDKSGSLYYNYKGYYSIVLQAVVDANYRYICIDVGGYGSQHDAATFKASQLYKALMLNKLNLPNASKIGNSDVCLPYFLIGDGAYPLSNILIKPYRGPTLLHHQKIFNKSLSKARVVVENAFGQTSQKWRILYTNIDKSPEIINSIIKCTCLLHNIIIDLERESHVHNTIVEQSIDDFVNDDDVQIISAELPIDDFINDDDVQIISVEQPIDDFIDDDVQIISVTGENLRDELAALFMKNHLCRDCS